MDGSFFPSWRRAPEGDQLRGPQGRDDLADAVDRAAFGRPVEHELSALAALLDDDETVQQVVEGGTGVAVLTTRRILVKVEGIDPALIIERADVIRAAGRTHRGMGTLTLKTRSGNLVVDQILGTQAETFAANVTAPVPEVAPADPIAALADLRAAHRAGTIGDDEFETRKRQLVEEI
ncbi:SHOCT domain-containing protein [Kineosporia succinea]|uniref:Oligomerization/nucleic acid binding protein n=1 Tax=Kineosporia succinea TaxID=84632 RepID=A0ABT9PAM0_9ACTN|nr:SHOCT domain-containing protein [Kineosporia succinea]MDP9829747.1 hypothetical protein [Kineosporia succinea]